MSIDRRTKTIMLAAALTVWAAASVAQTFDSGSDGSDGALVLDTVGTVVFDPSVLGLDADGDGVYHFTTITIGPSTTVRLGADVLGTRPVVWLASGDVTIDGFLDLIGGDGHAAFSAAIPAVAGAGGFTGGVGRTANSGATPGEGPGGGSISDSDRGGGHAGHVVAGQPGVGGGGAGGAAYGNTYLMPLVGGSGGAGGGGATGAPGGGGAAGGGAILIASSVLLRLDGGIWAYGGFAGGGSNSGVNDGGYGSGGSVRLIAPILEGSGGINVDQALGASTGRIRLEAFQQRFQGFTNGDERFATPGPVFPPANAPSVRIAAVDGVAAPASPSGGYAPADVVINAGGPVTLDIEASQIPLGAVVHLVLTSESQERVEVDSTPLAGTLEASTATATVTIPSGFSRFTVQADWTP